MSKRGGTFLRQWLGNNVPDTAQTDAALVDELTHKLIADAKSLGIRRAEIDEEVDDLHQTIHDAILRLGPGGLDRPE
jgi:hypothetical protein